MSKMSKTFKIDESVEQQIKRLTKYIGATVMVEYVFYGHLTMDATAKLRKVGKSVAVETRLGFVPFVGYGCAIRKITIATKSQSQPKIIYCNPYIPENYDARSIEERYSYIALTFGKNHANKWLEFQPYGQKDNN